MEPPNSYSRADQSHKAAKSDAAIYSQSHEATGRQNDRSRDTSADPQIRRSPAQSHDPSLWLQRHRPTQRPLPQNHQVTETKQKQQGAQR
jgi:hypothetical protein